MIGNEKYNKLVKFILRYLSDIDLPIRRGTFIEFRNGMINVSPIGRNASTQERNDYEKFDKQHHIRETMVEALKKEFPDFGLTYSIGGQISLMFSQLVGIKLIVYNTLKMNILKTFISLVINLIKVVMITKSIMIQELLVTLLTHLMTLLES